MKDVFKIEEMVIKHTLDFEVVELVLHSYNVLAKKFHSENDLSKEFECYNKKEIIMEYLLDPVEIHIINNEKYLVFEGIEHRFHEPFKSLTTKEMELYEKMLPIKTISKREYTGRRIRGSLSKEMCDEFYNMVIENDFTFKPLN